MTKKVALLFGARHDHEKNTQPHWPVVDQLHGELPDVEVYAITSPSTSLSGEGFSLENTRELRVVGGKLVAVAYNESPLTPDDITVAYDRTGTISADGAFARTVVNHPSIRQIGQGKSDKHSRKAILDQLGIPHDFVPASEVSLNGFEEALSGTGAKPVELRIYHHVAPEATIADLWVPVAYGLTNDGDRPVYRTVARDGLGAIAEQSRAITRAFVEAAGQTDAIGATGWVYQDGVWTVTAPNTGNVQHGATKLDKDPDGHETRRNVGRHLAAILSRAS